jgi:hypothetical protein
LPVKNEKPYIPLPREKRRNVKLSLKQREEIVVMHKDGATVHGLARTFSVSRRLIQFIVDPDRLKRVMEARKARGGSKLYYNKEENTQKVA